MTISYQQLSLLAAAVLLAAYAKNPEVKKLRTRWSNYTRKRIGWPIRPPRWDNKK